ncbi:MAG: zinc ABC transporter substrate-binding protein [Parcubacteria group bacterium]
MDIKLKILVIGMAVIVVALLLVLILVPSDTFKNDNDDGKLHVVATFFPLYDFTRNIADDKIELDILFTQTPHVSSFKPSDIQKINDADILIINGMGFEPIIEDIIVASGNDHLLIIDTSKDIALQENDPHIWLDPINAIKQVTVIRNALVQNDPDNTELYVSNAQSYIADLLELDETIRNTVTEFSQKDIIVFHSAFRYFTERYNLNQAAVFEETPGKEPSPSDLADIINTVKELGITALFAEPQFSPKIVETIANDLNIEVKVLNPIETGDLDEDTYIDLMLDNLQELKSVLQ